ncbi:hypothetical protein ACPUYX_11345 [Desulfosporosinus sp. SYSU MS00001]|uniref:hypothetical protein n=1 Tax=Desulfosporosinus sp. SYSU MS00001 TaxID=3416284 RepID=UPI003CF60CD7
MSGFARMEEVNKFIEVDGQKIKVQYEKLLLGKFVIEFLGTIVDYYVYANVRLCDNTVLETHFRWSDEQEDQAGKELDDRCWLMETYYKKFILGKEITRVEVGLANNMFDECYVKAFVSQNAHLLIPLGINSFRHEYRRLLQVAGLKKE